MENKDKYVFQVNLKGMISLLSEHLYSDPTTFVRELLQNGVDAITAMKNLDENHNGEVHVTLADDNMQLLFQDNGIGLKEDEIHRFIAVIGESSKRDSLDAQDFIGKFGIGLLSCFVVSDTIILETRSALSEQALRWIGKADGTYEIEEIAETRPIGTKVILTPKKEWLHLFTKDALVKSLKYFGDLLPIQIDLKYQDELIDINKHSSRWLESDCDKKELLEIGKSIFHTDFIDAFRINTNAGKVKMVVYILPYRTQFSGKQSHRLYLKRMFLADDDCRLLPRWSFFVRCLINTDGLNATASRESLMANTELREAQKEISTDLKNYLKTIGDINPVIYDKLIQVHYLHLKAIASEDTELLKVFIKDLPFETNKGVRTFEQIKDYQDTIYYSSNIDEFKQLRRVADSQGVLIVNAGYTFEEEILKKTKHIDSSVKIKEIEPKDILNSFRTISTTESDSYSTFLAKANKTLKEFKCEAIMMSFQPEDISALYITSGQILSQKNANAVSAKNPLTDILGSTSSNKEVAKPQLCFNSNNALIKQISSIKDDYLLHSIVQILYVQALMLGRYPINDKEMNIFNEGVQSLLVMGIENFINL